MSIQAKQLAKEIREFIAKFAEIKADFDPEFDSEEERFAGPDSSEMEVAAKMIEMGEKPILPFSSWHSGCYKLNVDPKGFEIHQSLHEKIKEMIVSLEIDSKVHKKTNIKENPSFEVDLSFEYRGWLVQKTNLKEFGVLNWMFEPLDKKCDDEREWRTSEENCIEAIDEYEEYENL